MNKLEANINIKDFEESKVSQRKSEIENEIKKLQEELKSLEVK